MENITNISISNPDEINYIMDLEKENKRRRDYEYETHIHKEGRTTASNAGKCIMEGALYLAGIPMPIMTGMKADTSVLDVGDEFHRDIQFKLATKYTREPISSLDFGCEVLVRTELYSGMEAVSRVDLAHAIKDSSGTAFHEEPFEYCHETRNVVVLNPEAKWFKIGDIKTASMYSYLKIRKEGLPFSYKAQGHIYMKATGLRSISFLIVNKEKGWKYTIVCNWEDKIWDEVIRIAKRKQELTTAFLKKQDLPVEPQDFACLDTNVIDWYSCPLSKTHEEERSTGQPTLVLDNVCDFCAQYMKAYVLQKVKVGTVWNRGKSVITIQSITDTEIISRNMSNTEYKDNFCYAYREYEPHN